MFNFRFDNFSSVSSVRATPTDVAHSCLKFQWGNFAEIGTYNLHLLQYPVEENSFFDIFAKQLTSHPLMQDEGKVVTADTVCKVLHNYIVNNAQEIEVNYIIWHK